MQTYRVDVSLAQVIVGNEVLLKCDIPSFASDFVSVNAWIDSEGVSYTRENHFGIWYMILAGVDLKRKYKQFFFGFAFFFTFVYKSNIEGWFKTFD